MSFVDALDGLATRSKTQIKLKILEVETSVKTKLDQIFSTLNQHRCHKEPVLEFEDECIKEEADEKEEDLSTQYIQIEEFNLLICCITWKNMQIFSSLCLPHRKKRQ